jgi:hypothetical protein
MRTLSSPVSPNDSFDIILFEDFRLDRRADGVFRREDGGAFVPVAIGSRGLHILDSRRESAWGHFRLCRPDSGTVGQPQ